MVETHIHIDRAKAQKLYKDHYNSGLPTDIDLLSLLQFLTEQAFEENFRIQIETKENKYGNHNWQATISDGDLEIGEVDIYPDYLIGVPYRTYGITVSLLSMEYMNIYSDYLIAKNLIIDPEQDVI